MWPTRCLRKCLPTGQHQHGRWEARIGRVAGNKDLYLGTFTYGMEGNMDMTSNASNSTAAAASARHNHQQEEAKKVRAGQQVGGSGEPKLRPTQEAGLCCPRCTSDNTKFCYYNNYNLNQPRHFCKNCRRYWTQGGSLRLVPVGGGCRRNKRASGSSSSSARVSSTAATSTKMENTFKTRLMLTAASTMSMPRSPTTALIPNDMLPTFTPTGGSSGLDIAMEEQQGFLPFATLSLSDDQAPELAPGGSDLDFLPFAPLALSDDQALELAPGGGDMGFLPFTPLSLSNNQALELAPGGSDTNPTFLDMLTGGYFDAGRSSFCYDGGLSFGGGSNGMDMSYLLPGMGASASDPMQMQLLEGINDIAGELQWPSAELDDYFTNDGGYAAAPAAGAEQQQAEEDNNKAKGAEG